jgi:hypothetical protein
MMITKVMGRQQRSTLRPPTLLKLYHSPGNAQGQGKYLTLQRASGVAFGPVTNFLATILGYYTSSVSATATGGEDKRPPWFFWASPLLLQSSPPKKVIFTQ